MLKLFVLSALGFALFGCQSTENYRSVARRMSSTEIQDPRAARASSLSGSVTKFLGLQQDGTPVQVEAVKCENGTCLSFKAGNSAPQIIHLSNRPLNFIEIGLMGHHFAGMYETLYVYYNFEKNAGGASDLRSGIQVIDPNKGRAVAFVDNASMLDYNYYNTYFSLVKGPDQRSYPFLAPGMHYLDKPYWPFMCMFDTKNITKPDSNCGTGFRSASISFKDKGDNEVKASGFRHNRGWLLDIDGDGWQDIHLPYFKYVLSLSGKTGKQISLAHFDVAEFTEPKTQKYFHQGRLYGGYTTFVDPRSKEYMTALISGSTVGSFSNWNCNVSRYTAALHWKRGSAKLDWADYKAFSTTQFTWDYSSVNKYFRRGDYVDNCIHRFSDSLIDVNGQPQLAYSLFNTEVKNGCEQETLAVQKYHMREPELTKFRACMENVSKSSPGVWSVHTKNAVTGQTMSDLPATYLWGRVDNFLPGEGSLYVLETFQKNGGQVRFDKEGHLPENYNFSRGPINSWSAISNLSMPGAVPKMDTFECNASQSGNDSSSPDASCGRPELVTQDVDGDGLNDILLETKPGELTQWMGYSESDKKIMIKKIKVEGT